MFHSNQTSVITKNIQVPLSMEMSKFHHFDKESSCSYYSPSPSPSSSCSSLMFNENHHHLSISPSEMASAAPTLPVIENPNLPDFMYNSKVLLNKMMMKSPDHDDTMGSSFGYDSYGKNPKRHPIPVPIENKDDAYWERRRRNNESAKRSRESRRKKELQTKQRILYLEQENIKLQAEVKLLREEMARLRQNELFQYLMKKRSYDL